MNDLTFFEKLTAAVLFVIVVVVTMVVIHFVAKFW